MAVVTKEDILTRASTLINAEMAETDEGLAFLEDVADTIDELSKGVPGDGEDWKAKFDENDKAWRTKYKERFLSGSSKEDETKEDETKEDEPKTYDSLFKKAE